MVKFREKVGRRVVVKEQVLLVRLRRQMSLADAADAGAAAGAVAADFEDVVVAVEQVLEVALEPVEKFVGVDQRRRKVRLDLDVDAAAVVVVEQVQEIAVPLRPRRRRRHCCRRNLRRLDVMMSRRRNLIVLVRNDSGVGAAARTRRDFPEIVFDFFEADAFAAAAAAGGGGLWRELGDGGELVDGMRFQARLELGVDDQPDVEPVVVDALRRKGANFELGRSQLDNGLPQCRRVLRFPGRVKFDRRRRRLWRRRRVGDARRRRLRRVLLSAPRPVLVIRILLHVEQPQPLGLHDEGLPVLVAQLFLPPLAQHL